MIAFRLDIEARAAVIADDPDAEPKLTAGQIAVMSMLMVSDELATAGAGMSVKNLSKFFGRDVTEDLDALMEIGFVEGPTIH